MSNLAILPGHVEAWSIDCPADLASATAPWRADRLALANVAKQMADQEVEPRERYRLASLAGFNNIEAATIAKMVKEGTWRAYLTAEKEWAA